MSKITIWKKLPGITGRCNDIIYSQPILTPSKDVVLYFGGDVQDTEQNMNENTGSKEYVEWSLENTAQILSMHFRNKHVLVVRPSRIHITRNAMFSCFDNFVMSNQHGVPLFLSKSNALRHLRQLLESCLNCIHTCSKNKDLNHFNIKETNITLVGFSKGCVVLNQLLFDFHYYTNELKIDIEINNFIKLIKSMWWLDGGHGGCKDTWITDKSILESFAKLRIDVQVHVTPYQVKDSHRPWIEAEESQFCQILRNSDASVQRILHFAEKPRSLENHFNILKGIGSYTY